MKIDGSSKDLGALTPVNTGGVRKSTSGTAAVGGEAVSLSDLSAQMHELEARLSAEPSFDSARVEQLKDAIRSGEYKVNTEAVADGLIASVRQFLDKPRG